ncbi:MAG TPA: hypothetical protein VNW46_02395 [Gemmatimonadaceae bacterium]|nr:hypothetical protein [Gemmatimonadaceae bacterium]
MERMRRGVLLGAVVVGQLGCNAQLPSGVIDPATFNTPAGALGLQHHAVYLFIQEAQSFAATSGLLTDELENVSIGGGPAAGISQGVYVDARLLPQATSQQTERCAFCVTDYSNLQAIRAQSAEALGAIGAYLPGASGSIRGHVYVAEGYAEVMLADLFCSGVPLSTLNYGKDFTYHAGSTTSQVYQHAAALFDTAYALATDSVELQNLARVGKGRVLLALGEYAAAAQEVAPVPDGFQYQVVERWVDSSSGQAFMYNVGTVSDREGFNGLPFISSGDPRTVVQQYATNLYNAPLYTPVKYAAPIAPIVVASGVEARLIAAEASLQAGNTTAWLATLNALRTDGTYTTHPDSANPSQTDTTYNAGTGGVAGLRPLADPGTADQRVDLLFNERAYWLFLTGHRQGDLRRLIRQYNRSQGAVYPIGPYFGGGSGINVYGSDVTVAVPAQERANPLFTGCLDRNA